MFFLLNYCILLTVFVVLNRPTLCSPEEPEITFEDLYQYGKDEYTARNWYDCTAFMRKALEDFDYFVGENDWCREKCSRSMKGREKQDAAAVSEDAAEGSVEISWMYAKAQQALCLFRCKAERFTALRPPLKDPAIYEDFENRRPYYYLQFCYWKQHDLKSAVQSAFTYLVANPNDTDALTNMAFYMERDGFEQGMLVDARQMKYEV
ncbi:unnamed protein product [Anisakis simplex]|uniref:TPR_REGION domain-containing protein n=1 Tax=Anisakis simplex TaxID=6269 RepID=A0A0M3KFL1_ANISI|nr:unnamed protein product [Anisakis simplex]